MDIPRPFAPALRGHIDALLGLYQDAAEAAAEASAEAGQAATAIGAPSRVLTAARAAARASLDASSIPPRPGRGEPASAGQPGELQAPCRPCCTGSASPALACCTAQPTSTGPVSS